MLEAKYQAYIDSIMGRIQANPETKQRFRQSLTEHVEVLIEKHGSMAFEHLAPAEQVANEFMENLDPAERIHTEAADNRMYRNGYFYGYQYYYRKVSKRKIFNLPLYCITSGYNPETGKIEVAKGIFAAGPLAVGVFCAGAFSVGVFTFSGISLALLLAIGGVSISTGAAIGGIALGGLLAIGGFAASFGMAIGGLASGHVAIGGRAFGEYYYQTETDTGNAVEWFRRYMPSFVKYFSR